jgi:hypothetical protein
MRSRYKKIIAAVMFLLIMLEIGLLAGDTYIYSKYKVAKNNVNGKIICFVDNLINFSGMASK